VQQAELKLSTISSNIPTIKRCSKHNHFDL